MDDVFKKSAEKDPVTPEKPEVTESDQESMAQALWRDGHERGYRFGYKLGFSNGNSTLGRQWFVVVTTAFLAAGMIMGIFMDFVTQCGPEIPCGIQLPADFGLAPINVIPEDVK